MKSDDAKRLKELERENARLKKMVAEQALGLSRKRLCPTFGGGYPLQFYPNRIRCRRRENPARPYIWRLISFVFVFTPSVGPLL